MKKIAICTISSHNYMAYGLTCLLSAKKYNSDVDLYYLVADRYDECNYEEYNEIISFIDLKDLDITNEMMVNMEFKYNIVEFNTSVKPSFYKFLFSKGYESVIYLDPDIECYASFDSFLNRNKNHSIIVTPHKMSTSPSELIEDKAFLNNGIYNLGFIALNRSESTDKFLTWWDEKLRNQCFIDYSTGLATDQIWVELASTIFDGFYVERDMGLNVAFWNIHERKLYKNKEWFIDDTPLIFFHFSSLSKNCSCDLLKKIEQINPGFEIFYQEHISNVNEIETRFDKIPYAFSEFNNGEMITKEMRWLYGFSEYLQKNYASPFDTEGNSFYKNILSSHRINKKNVYGSEKILKLIIFVFGVKRTLKLLSIGSIHAIKRVAELY